MDAQEILFRNLVIGEVLARNARKYPDRLAVADETKYLSYAQFNRRVNRLANGLQSLGVGKSQHVAVLLFNSLEILECFCALAKLGAVAVPINFRYIGPEIENQVNHSDSTTFVYDQVFSPVVSGLNIPAVQNRVVVGSSSQGEFAYEDLLGSASEEESMTPVYSDDIAHIMYTSGTTGRPKGAMLTHFNQLMNAINMTYETGRTFNDKQLLVMPLFHEAALSNFIQQIYIGAATIVRRRFDPRQVLQTIEQEQITILGLVPTMWDALLQVPDLEKYNLSSLRIIYSGTSIVPVSLKKRLLQRLPNAGLYDLFGQTEMSPTVTLLKPEHALIKTASVGQPIINIEIRIVDDDDQDLPVGEVGEAIYRGPTVFKGYYKDPQATAEAMRNTWFHSGDMLKKDKDGFFYVVDRKKDVIISGGENVYPAEIEAVLQQNPKICESAVIGVPHPKWGEGVHAVVVLKPGMELSKEEVVQWCAERLAGYKKPRSVEFVASLPRNTAGKVLKNVLREKHINTGR